MNCIELHELCQVAWVVLVSFGFCDTSITIQYVTLCNKWVWWTCCGQPGQLLRDQDCQKFGNLWPEICQFFAFLQFCLKQPGCRPDDASRPNSDPGHRQTFSSLNQLLSSMIPYLWQPPHHEDIDVYNGFAIVKVICFLSINVPEFWSQWLPVIIPCSSEDEDEALLLSVQRLD